MTSISREPLVVAHHHVDALELIQSIWRQKKQIAAFAAAFGVIAAIFAYSVTPEYEVSTVLRPVSLNDLDALNRSEIYSLPPIDALNRVGAALESYETRLGYYRSSPALQAAYNKPGRTEQQAFEKFNSNALKVVLPDPKKLNLLSAYIGLDMTYEQGLQGADELNGLVAYAIDTERARIAEDLKVIIANRIQEVDAKLAIARANYDSQKVARIAELMEADNLKRAELQDELRALRVQLKINREDRIAQLNEAIVIARSLGLKRPSTPSSMVERESGAAGNVIRTEVNNQQIPLYFMGSDALEAERQALRQRSSDDFADPRVAQIRKDILLLNNNRKVEVLQQRQNEEVFLKGIEALRAESTRLKHINSDMSGLQLVKIDQMATTPLSPVKPKKALLIALGVVLGGLIGASFSVVSFLLRVRNAQLGLASLHKVVEVDSQASQLSR